QESAAIRIQSEWRRWRRERTKKTEHMRRILSSDFSGKICLGNSQLIAQLEQVKAEREKQEELYEEIVRTPARYVNALLRVERERERRGEERKRGGREDHCKKRDQAARIITRNIRKYCIRRSIEKNGQRKLGLKRRLELMSILDERLAKSVDMRRKSLKEIERRRAERHEILDDLVRKGVLIDRKMNMYKREMAMVADLPQPGKSTDRVLNMLRTTRSSLREFIAEINHRKEMMKIEEMVLGL
ncbi:hypothetical protein PMAYCL1PPCAC_12752, partial [Pristionchus mayeri]